MDSSWNWMLKHFHFQISPGLHKRANISMKTRMDASIWERRSNHMPVIGKHKAPVVAS